MFLCDLPNSSIEIAVLIEIAVESGSDRDELWLSFHNWPLNSTTEVASHESNSLAAARLLLEVAPHDAGNKGTTERTVLRDYPGGS